MKQAKGIVRSGYNNPLFSANVYISDADGKVLNPPMGTTTNEKGEFTLNAPDGQGFITASYVGLKKKTMIFDESWKYDFNLEASTDANLKEIEITADKVKKKPKVPVGLIVFASLAVILIGAGIAIEVKQRA